MAINKALKTALKALSYPDPDIKKSYKFARKIEKLTAKRIKDPEHCHITTTFVERDYYQIPVRIFSPVAGNSKGVILFFHGGGWVKGDIDTYMGVCLDMQKELSRTVVSVDYRRAPEYKFPYATEDCYAVAQKLFDGSLLPEFLPEDVVVMGDSAGGNLAAVVSLMARDRGEFLPQRQILIYPSTGNDHSPDSQFASIRENGFDYLLTSKRIVGYMELYVSDKDGLKNPYLAPLLETDLRGQPNTLIITAQYCPLRDEGEEYGRRLSDAGNNVSVYRMPDLIHGYFSLPVKFKPVRKTYAIIRRFLGDDPIADNKIVTWNKLDNAAKIFPPTTSKNDSKVFRFYCELNEQIDSRLLQAALDVTINSFEFYRSVLKKGIFWYYLESTTLSPVVREEYKEPCSQLYDNNYKGLLFEVTYYKNRINFEVYHALTDGTGAANFFRTMVAHYLKKRHRKEINDDLLIDDASFGEKKDDSFFKYYKGQKISYRPRIAKSYHIRGERLTVHPLGIIEGEMSVQILLDKAHQYNCTLSVFLVSVLVRSIAEYMPLRERSKSIVIAVPVDLRQFYESKSARNFFAIVNIEYNISRQSDDFEAIIKSIKNSMEDCLDKEKISQRMRKLSKFENLLPARILPVFVKNPGLKIINHFAGKGVTATFSNLGRITMPTEYAAYIRKIGVMSSTTRLQACMCSFGGRFIIVFTSPFESTDVQCRFFRTLVQMGIEVEITSNLGSDNNVIL